MSWNFITQMSKHVSLTVIYGNYDDVPEYIASNPIENVRWINIPMKKYNATGLIEDIYYYRSYSYWLKKAAETVERLIKAKEIDIIHFLNPIGFKQPGFCWKFKDVPYVWGPIQGVDNRPLKLCYDLDKKFFFKAIVRRILHNGMFMFMPTVRQAIRRTDLLYAATPATIKGLNRYHGRNDVIALPEHSLLEMETEQPKELLPGQQLRIIWVGAIVERKALEILLLALAKVKSADWHLSVVGDGPLRIRLQEKYRHLASNITFHGKISRQQTQDVFRQSHLHVISSLGEASTTVLFEAMAKGIPTMALDHCGMAGIICNKCGIKIPLGSLSEVTDMMADRISDIIERPQRIRELSCGVLKCSQNFLWEQRCRIFMNGYNSLIAKNNKSRT